MQKSWILFLVLLSISIRHQLRPWLRLWLRLHCVIFPAFATLLPVILALAVGLAFATALYPCPSLDLVDWWTLVARLLLSVSRICRALPAAVWAALAATTTSGHPAVHQSRAQWLSTASQTSGGSSGSGVPNARWHDRRLSASCRSRTPTHSTARTPRRHAAVCTR